MARVTIKATSFTRKAIIALKKSDFIAAQLEPIAAEVLAAAKQDPNEEYTKTLQMRTFVTGGPGGRISWQIGAAPTIGARVEAKRGTLQRAIGSVGL